MGSRDGAFDRKRRPRSRPPPWLRHLASAAGSSPHGFHPQPSSLSPTLARLACLLLRAPSRSSWFNHPGRQPRITPMPRINPPSVRSVKSVVLPRPLQTADSASVYSVCSVVKPPPHDLFAPFAVQSPEQTTTDHTDSTDQSPIRAIREISGASPTSSRPQRCFRVARVFRGAPNPCGSHQGCSDRF